MFSALSHFAIHLYAKQELFTSGSRDRHQYNLFRFIVPILTNLITVINIVIAFFIAFFLHKHRFAAASVGCLFLICQLHIIAELVHHLHESLIHDLLPALGDAVHVSKGYPNLLRNLPLRQAALVQASLQIRLYIVLEHPFTSFKYQPMTL